MAGGRLGGKFLRDHINRSALRVSTYHHQLVVTSDSSSVLTDMPRTFRPRNIPCPIEGCGLFFTNQSGVKNHLRIHRQIQPTATIQPRAHTPSADISIHGSPPRLSPRSPSPPSSTKEDIRFHPLINGKYRSCWLSRK